MGVLNKSALFQRVNFWQLASGGRTNRRESTRRLGMVGTGLFRCFARRDRRPNNLRKGVERTGGRVGVGSEPGKGSCFWIELPALSSPSSSPSPSSS